MIYFFLRQKEADVWLQSLAGCGANYFQKLQIVTVNSMATNRSNLRSNILGQPAMPEYRDEKLLVYGYKKVQHTYNIHNIN